MSKKYCPMMNGDSDESIFCMEEECAWWNKSLRMCGAVVEAHIAAVKWSCSE